MEKGVRLVLTQQLEVDMLPYMSELGARNVDDIKSLKLVRAVMQISRAGYAVKYMLPELYEPFELVQIRVLPFSLTDNAQMVRFRLESELVAMNSVGESFLFRVGICMREQDLRICDIRGIELHRKALTCVKSLLTDSDDIPDICKKTVVIVAPTRQEYVYHELENRVSVFSHVKENFTVNCGDVTSQHCLGKGLNSVLLPVGCEASTSELRIMAPSVGADDTTLKPLIHELDIIDEIGELGKDLVALHGINVSMLSDELSEYMKALKVEELDIDKVSVTLENMRHLSDIKEYSVTKLSLKDIGSVSSTVTITAWTVAVLILLLVTATCCKCCSPCAAVGTAVWDLLKCIFGGLWSFCKWLVGRKGSEPKMEK